MEKGSIPMIYYLNDGEEDKTGFERLKRNAIRKALRFYTDECGATIGPNAVQRKKDNLSPFQKKNIEYNYYSENIKTPTPCSSQSKKSVDQSTYDSSESPEQKEERLIRGKILASLERICLNEAQEKVNAMRRDWDKRQEETMRRLQEELNEEVENWQNTTLKKLTSSNSELFSDTLPDLLLNKPEEEKEKRITDRQAIMKDLQEIAKRKEILEQISTEHSKLLQITNEVTECMKFDDAKFRNSITSDIKSFKESSNEFSQLISSYEQRNVTNDILKTARNIVNRVNEIYKDMKEKADQRKKEIEIESKIEEEKKKAPEEKLNQEVPDTTMEEDIHVEEASSCSNEAPQKKEVLPADPMSARRHCTLKYYEKYYTIYSDVEASLKEFMSNDSLKKFRSECQRVVNVPVNAISGVSAAHLNDKHKKLRSVLHGEQVIINGKPFNPSQHPLGVLCCTFLLAEKIVRQGQDVVSSKPDSAFPIALLVLALWGEFPLFGDLLMAVFHNVCPYLIPIYWEKEEEMTDDDYYRKLGFIYSSGEREDINMFLKRQTGVVRLYFSIVVSPMKVKSKQHPLDVNEAWRWLAMFTSLEPSAEITATLLFDMLDVAGYALAKTYGKQFFKLIHLICVQYLPKVEKATPSGKGGPVCRLKSFLEELIRSQSVKPPKGLMPSNFW